MLKLLRHRAAGLAFVGLLMVVAGPSTSVATEAPAPPGGRAGAPSPPPPSVAPRPTPPPPQPPGRADDSLRNEPVPEAPTSPFTPGVQNTAGAPAWSGADDWGQGPPNALRGRDLTEVRPESLGRGGSQGPILLRVSDAVQHTVRYELFSQGQRYRYDLTTGHKQQFREDRVWGIRFHRGSRDEFVSYRLLEGEYEFAWTDNGWELFLAKAGPDTPPPPPRRAAADAISGAGGAPPPQPIPDDPN